GLILALAVSLVASVAFSEPMSQEMAARTELHSIDTLTLSDAQFLGGDANAKATTTAGQLRIARGSGRLPLVVLQHGSGGMAGNVEMWERELNAIGVSTFALDGFTGRGLTAVNTNQALLGRLNFILDIYRALDVLAKHPRVAGKVRSPPASNASTRCGIDRASSSQRIFRSILTARQRSYPTPRSPT